MKLVILIYGLFISQFAIAGNASSGGDTAFRTDLTCGENRKLQVSIEKPNDVQPKVQLYIPLSAGYSDLDVMYGTCEKLPGTPKNYLICKVKSEKTSYQVGVNFRSEKEIFASVTQGDDTLIALDIRCQPFIRNW